MTKWFWVKMDEDSEWVPATQSTLNKDRFYPADASGWFETEEIWAVGPPIAPPTDAQPGADEREALVEVIVRGMARSAANSSMVGQIADALLADGWTRSPRR